MREQVSVFSQPSISKEAQTYHTSRRQDTGAERGSQRWRHALCPQEPTLQALHPATFSTQTHVASRAQVWFSPRRRNKGNMVGFVAYTVTVLQTQSSLRSLWTRGLGESDLEEELFELNL